MRPRRKVERTPRGYEVTAGGKAEFITTAEHLAHKVAREYDRVDPLPCEHEWTYVDIGTWGGLVDRKEFCAWCGKGRNDG